jgi:hypothetical protein
MSAETMIACAAKEIIIGKHSSLGPTDPQFETLSGLAVLEEFETAKKETCENTKTVLLWKEIISKYHPPLLDDCPKLCIRTEKLVASWLESNMFSGDSDSAAKLVKVSKFLGDYEKSMDHSKHFLFDELKEIGLKITELEKDPKLQDLVLTIHHTFMHAFTLVPIVKITENHMGVKVIASNSLHPTNICPSTY